MTHSNHRQGTCRNLSDDFVVLAKPGGTSLDPKAAIHRFRDIGFRHGPVNVPGIQSPLSAAHLVYDSKEKVTGFLKDMARADLGLSITVAGPCDTVEECCHAADLDPYLVNLSLGFWGKTAMLPPHDILEITTMCGHGRISPNLVWDLAGRVSQNKMSPAEASRKMGKLCLCNIFNEVRAAKLMPGLVAGIQGGSLSPPNPAVGSAEDTPEKNSGITIDRSKCTGCLDCIPYCPVSAIVEIANEGSVAIDPVRCTECGVCWQTDVCPTGAIVARELAWPRTLRGKFHNFHAPYRATPIMAEVSHPLGPGGTVQSFPSHQFPSELDDDFKGKLQPGENVVIVELGRPHLGTTFRDVQKVAQALLPVGLKVGLQYPPSDERTPLNELMVDSVKAIFRRDILDERTGWVVFKMLIRQEERPRVLQTLLNVAGEIDTVFAVNILSRVENSISSITARIAAETGVKPSASCKTNVGLGTRPGQHFKTAAPALHSNLDTR